MCIMRLAITSTDGVSINSHFEMTDTFFIYDVQGGKKVFVEKRVAQKYSGTTDNMRFKRNRFKGIYETIKDCSTIVTQGINPLVVAKLEEYGIATKTIEGKIATIII